MHYYAIGLRNFAISFFSIQTDRKLFSPFSSQFSFLIPWLFHTPPFFFKQGKDIKLKTKTEQEATIQRFGQTTNRANRQQTFQVSQINTAFQGGSFWKIGYQRAGLAGDETSSLISLNYYIQIRYLSNISGKFNPLGSSIPP